MNTAQTKFTLVALPHNAQPGMGSLPHWMPSHREEVPEANCRVYLWNPVRGAAGAWDAITKRDDLTLFTKALAKAESIKGAPLASGDFINYTAESGNRWRFLVD